MAVDTNFPKSPFTTLDPHIRWRPGSNTNEDTLSDGSSLQEFSIRLEADIDEKYQDDMINLMKPMGFNFDLVKAETSIYSGSVTGTDKVEPYEIVVS